jgi:outer membrane protein, heavy metal efflux system
MKFLLLCLFVFPLRLVGQTSVADTVRLSDLVREALTNNRDMEAAELLRDAAEARVSQAGALDDPELTYMREEMPGFRWNEAQMQKVELMQMFRFPTKLSTQVEIADIAAEHLHHEHMEVANEVLAKLRSMYAELWYAQEAIKVNRENGRLLQRFTQIAQTRYGLGSAPQQDVLKSYVEMAKLDNELLQLRQQELTAKAMLQSLTNRQSRDTLGVAVLGTEMKSLLDADTLQGLALRFRGMLLHDSLSVLEGDARVSLAKSEFIPDFKLGIQYVSIPDHNFRGWSVTAGITLPFAPWTLGKANSRIEEAEIMTKSAHAKFAGTRNMILASVRELSYKADALKKQLHHYSRVIVPQSRQALQASLMAYQTGKMDYLMLVDSYRMLAMLSMEQLMLRMQYEQTLAELIRTVGYSGIFETIGERN